MEMPLLPVGMIYIIFISLAALLAAGTTLYLSFYKFKTPEIRRRRILAVLIFIGLLLLLFLVVTGSNMLGRYQLEKKFAKARAQQIPVTVNELSASYTLPPNATAQDNGEYFYAAARNLFKVADIQKLWDLTTLYSTYELQKWDIKDRRTAQQQLANADIDLVFTLVHRGTKKPFAMFKRDFSQGYATVLPDLSSQRQLYRLAMLKSIALGIDGKATAGYQIITDGFRAIKQFETDPTLIPQLGNIACTSINLDALDNLLTHYGIDDHSAQQLMDALSRLNPGQGMTLAMNGEIAVANDFISRLMTGKWDQDVLKLFGFKSSSMMEVTAFISPVLYWDWNYYVKNMMQFRELMSKPYWQIADQLKLQQSMQTKIPFYYVFSKEMMLHMFSLITKIARIDSEITVARLSLALHLYKNRHGVFPEKLEQLTPEIIKDIPVDPISGKSLVYSKDDKYFILSSVWLKEKQDREKTQALKRNTHQH